MFHFSFFRVALWAKPWRSLWSLLAYFNALVYSSRRRRSTEDQPQLQQRDLLALLLLLLLLCLVAVVFTKVAKSEQLCSNTKTAEKLSVYMCVFHRKNKNNLSNFQSDGKPRFTLSIFYSFTNREIMSLYAKIASAAS